MNELKETSMKDFMMPSMKMVNACRADDFDFFLPFIESGHITVGQMHHAAQRYHLGKTKSGKPLFWMIDDKDAPLDAHLTDGTWLSTLLKARETELLEFWRVKHCLFGLHLLKNEVRGMKTKVRRQKEEVYNHSLPIGIVESERSAVILRELFTESIWMAYTTPSHLDIDLFAPLQGHNVTIYPPTDPTFSTFLFFDEFITTIRRYYNIHITVNRLLEDHATDDQKERCIDILDYIIEEGG